MKWDGLINLGIGLLLLVFLSCNFGGGKEEVNVYSHRHYPVDQEIFQMFTDETGIEVNVVSASADELITKLELEGDRSPADVLITVDAGRLEKAKQSGLLQTIQSDILNNKVDSQFRDVDHQWYAFTYRARAIVYVPERISKEMVSTYEALSSENLKGRLLMRSSEHTYNQSLMASFYAHKGPDSTAQWCEGIARNLARSPRGGDRDQLKGMASGQGDVSVCNTYYVAKMAESPVEAERNIVDMIEMVFPNQEGRGTHINISGAGVTTHSPNKANAVRFIEFLLSEEVQTKFSVENHEYPILEGTELSKYLREWGEFKIDSLPFHLLGKYNDEAVRIMDNCGWM